jgi:hypothetical protein
MKQGSVLQQYHDFGAAVAADPEVAKSALDKSRDRFAALSTPLPDQPDEAAVESWLHRVRAELMSAEFLSTET